MTVAELIEHLSTLPPDAETWTRAYDAKWGEWDEDPVDASTVVLEGGKVWFRA